jgi:hypothetical protein
VSPILALNVWAGCHPCHAFIHWSSTGLNSTVSSSSSDVLLYTKYEAQTLFTGYFCHVRSFVSILFIPHPPIKWMLTANFIIHCVDEVNMKWAVQLKEKV